MYIQQTFDWAGTKPPDIQDVLDRLAEARGAELGAVFTKRESAFNEQTGALLWSKNIGASSDPSVANGIVYVEAPCNLEALSTSTGALLWTFDKMDIGYCVENTPIIANGVVYVGSSNDDSSGEGNFFMLNATTGTPVGQVSIDTGVMSNNISPSVVVNGTVYCLANGALYAYRLPSIATSKKSA